MSSEVEQALVEARRRGALDEELLAVLRREPLLLGVEEVDGSSRPAARQVGSSVAVLTWTSQERAERAGWSGDLVAQPGGALAGLLLGTGLGLVVNAGDDPAVQLDHAAVARLADPDGAVAAGTRVYLGEPAVPHEALETALASELHAVAAVQQARIAIVVTEPGPPESRLTVVLTLRPGASAQERDAAFAACDRAAATTGLVALHVVVDDQLGGLRDAALQLPAVLHRG